MSLCTTADVKEYMGITSSSLDALIASLITRMEAFIKRYTGRVFEAADYVEQYDADIGNGGILLLLQYPVISVTTLWDDPNRVFGDDTIVGTSDYVVYSVEGSIRLDDTQATLYQNAQAVGVGFQVGLQSVKVSYRAGYEDGAIPADLTQACIELVAYKLTSRKGAAVGVKTRRLADASFTYVQGVAMSEETKETLDSYSVKRLYVI